MAKLSNTVARNFEQMIRKVTTDRPARAVRGGVRRAVQHEKFEQQKGVDLLRSIGASVYTFGTRRSKGSRCPKCGEFVPNKDRGTRQSEGVPDVLAFLPRRPGVIGATNESALLKVFPREVLWWEAKRPGGGAESDDQAEFRQLCAASSTAHCLGDVDELMTWLVEHGYLKAENLPHYRRAGKAGRA